MRSWMVTCVALAAMNLVAHVGAETTTLVHGRIWTGDPARPWAEAVGIAGERIVAVGSREAVGARIHQQCLHPLTFGYNC